MPEGHIRRSALGLCAPNAKTERRRAPLRLVTNGTVTMRLAVWQN
jgi:hypothetical protein